MDTIPTVEGKKKVLIIRDNTASTGKIAENIAGVLNKRPFTRYAVSIIDAISFSATDLLPSQVFFIGCGEPDAFEKLYIKDLFLHINLAGRSCGIFSADPEAITYLSSVVRDSGVTVKKTFLAMKNHTDSIKLKQWIQEVIQEGFHEQIKP
jgi:hypothetical protein